jgi:hypothetical protein
MEADEGVRGRLPPLRYLEGSALIAPYFSFWFVLITPFSLVVIPLKPRQGSKYTPKPFCV